MAVDGTVKTTTARREWWGWFGSMVWLFFLMYGYSAFVLAEWVTDEDLSTGADWIPFSFMMVFAISIILFSRLYGRDPQGLSKIAFYTTPAALVITAVFALLPSPFNAVLFIISPVLFAPAMTRRVYGVLYTSAAGRKITRYMGGITLCVVAFTIWMIIEPPKEVAFLVPALLALPAWIGVRRCAPLPNDIPAPGAHKLSKSYILLFAVALIVLLWFDTMTQALHSVIVTIGVNDSNILLTVLGMILPPTGFMLLGIIHDKGHERIGFICAMGLCIIGIILAIIPGEAYMPRLLLLAVTDGLGGSYIEFFILTVPVFFLSSAKRPVFVSALGVIINLITSAYLWIVDLWLPVTLRVLDTPLLVSAAISGVAFIILVHIAFERRREKTLAASLHALLYGGRAAGDSAEDGGAMWASPPTAGSGVLPTEQGGAMWASPPTAETQESADTQIMSNAGLTPEEIRVAMLLMEGNSRSDVLRKLHINAAEADQHEKSIRRKLQLMSDPDPVIAEVTARYKLTKRETEVLRFLRRSAGNDEIASELYLSDDTVKGHIRNIMKKLPVEKRRDVPAWLESLEQE